MAIFHKISSRLKPEINTGFGVNPSSYGGRFINKDGEANVKKKGIGFFEKISWFHTMLMLSRWKFFFAIILFYVCINLLFAIVYFSIGVQSLGLVPSQSLLHDFAESFFFSTQTFTTVGYGHISPNGFLSNSVASLEALLGLLSLALATGLLYGRFSKPVAYLRFSHNALISPFKDINAIMFRVAPYKNINLTDAAVNVTLGMIVEENNVKVNKFYQLELEYRTVNSLPLSWTIVHPITEQSPLYNFSKEDFENTRGEIMVFLKAFDDKFSNIVVARTSYIFEEIKYGAKFDPMYERDTSGEKTIIYVDKINSFQPVALNTKVNKEDTSKDIDDLII